MALAKVRLMKYKVRPVDSALIENILKDIARGGPKKHVALANGISETTFHNLVRQGICDIDNNISSLEADMVVSLNNIELDEITELRDKIKENEKGHSGAEWVLEHAHWRTFSTNAPAKELADEIERMQQLLKEQNDGKANNSKKKKDSKK
jgi:hypothetical protein